jgi:hypothetical protein
MFPTIRKGTVSNLNGSSASYKKGIEDGKKVNLNRPIGGSDGTKRIIS